MTIEILDPTHEAEAAGFVSATRLTGLEGKTVGIVSNGKEGTKAFFKAFEQELTGRYGVARVVHRTKSNYSAPMDAPILKETGDWDVVIAGIGD